MIVICKNMTRELPAEQQTREDTNNTIADLDKPVYTRLSGFFSAYTLDTDPWIFLHININHGSVR